MEAVFFYSRADEKAMKKVLDDDLLEKARKLLAESPAKELKGEEGEAVLKAFREQAEAAEAGMGTLFG